MQDGDSVVSAASAPLDLAGLHAKCAELFHIGDDKPVVGVMDIYEQAAEDVATSSCESTPGHEHVLDRNEAKLEGDFVDKSSSPLARPAIKIQTVYRVRLARRHCDSLRVKNMLEQFTNDFKKQYDETNKQLKDAIISTFSTN